MKRRIKVPSFAGLRPASPLSSRIKKANRSCDTSQEVALRGELSKLGLRFKANDQEIPGRPDIVFSGVRLAVFCDGDFWHGRRWNSLRRNLQKGANASYWRAKISTNMRRDKKTTRLLRRRGWEVVTVWESDIKADPRAVAEKLKKVFRGLS